MSNRGVLPYDNIKRPQARETPVDIKQMLMNEIIVPDTQEGYQRFGPGNPRVASSGNIGAINRRQNAPFMAPKLPTVEPENIIPIPREISIHNDWGIIDQYIYCDSQYKEASSDSENGLLVFSVVKLNHGKPIDTIIEMEIEEFYIPTVDEFPPSLPQPQTFFFKRNTLLLKDASPQAIFGANNLRHHWEFDVEPQGISNLLTPTKSKFIFGRPFISLNQLSFEFRTPTGLVALPQDTYIAVPLRNTSPARWLLTESFSPQQMDYLVAPDAPSVALVGGGNLSVGYYRWVVTFVTREFNFNTLTYSVMGETDQGSRSDFMLAAAGNAGSLTNIPLDIWSANTGPPGGPPVNIRAQTTRRIYRTTADGNTFYFAGEINDNVTTVFLDLASDADIIAGNIPGVDSTGEETVPEFNTTGGPTSDLTFHGLTLSTSIPLPVDAVATIVGGGGGLSPAAPLAYSWVITFLNAHGETIQGPSFSNAMPALSGDRAVLTNIPQGDPGTLARNIYRTTSGGTVFGFAFTINNNEETTAVDRVMDSALGAAPPTTDGTGGSTFTTYITGLDINNSTLNETFNSQYGHLVTVPDFSTVETTYTIGAIPNFYYSQVVVNGRMLIAYRRIAFSIRFRSLVPNDLNHITPV